MTHPLADTPLGPACPNCGRPVLTPEQCLEWLQACPEMGRIMAQQDADPVGYRLGFLEEAIASKTTEGLNRRHLHCRKGAS